MEGGRITGLIDGTGETKPDIKLYRESERGRPARMRPLAVGSGQRLLIIIGGLLLLPAILLLAWALILGLMRAQATVEVRALDKAKSLITAVDNQLAVERGALRTFSTADTLMRRDWRAAARRSRSVMSVNPGWRAVLVVDERTGRAVVDTRVADGGAPRPVPTGTDLELVRTGDGCPCVILHQPLPGAPGFDLVALIDPRDYQSMLMREVDEGVVIALVDRRGNFVARSLDFDKRVGTPATIYVRNAVAKGGTGVYRGRTYEGLENYSAYFTSVSSDWSAHVAVSNKLIDTPRFWLFIVLVGGALATLLAGGGVITYGLIDMAARRRTEEQMLRLQKGEAIGRFSSGVAHDFNNLLTVVIGNLERIRSADVAADVKRRAGMALEAAQRGARLSNQLLSFAREGGADKEAVDVAALLNDVSELLRQSVGDGVTLTIAAAADAGTAVANRDQLELALLNLAINARDAMAGQGALDVSARRAGGMVEIAVTDTGTGIPAALRERLFEPFFTTKPAGQGTGLGLAQVAGAAAQAGGSVRVEDREGTGARFIISLPSASSLQDHAGA